MDKKRMICFMDFDYFLFGQEIKGNNGVNSEVKCIEILTRKVKLNGYEYESCYPDILYYEGLNECYLFDSMVLSLFDELIINGIDKNKKYFINISNDSLQNDKVDLLIMKLKKIHSKGIDFVLEISERKSDHSSSSIICGIKKLIANNFNVAIDDYDFSDEIYKIEDLVDISPSYVKLSYEYLKNTPNYLISADIFYIKSRLVETEIIMEGVENENEYFFLKNVNCDYLQGFYIDLPKAIIYESIKM